MKLYKVAAVAVNTFCQPSEQRAKQRLERDWLKADVYTTINFTQTENRRERRGKARERERGGLTKLLYTNEGRQWEGKGG